MRVARGRAHRTPLLWSAVWAAALSAGGCPTMSNWVPPDPKAPAGVEGMVLRDGRLQADTQPGRGAPQLAAAMELYRQDNFAAAEKAFHKVAENTKNSPLVAEEARFYEAECLYRQNAHPK